VYKPKTLHRKKRALTEAIQKLNDHLQTRFDLPPIGGSEFCHESQDRQQADSLVTPATAANRLGLSPATLANWRVSGTSGLPFVRVGSRIFYRQTDIDAFIRANLKTSTSHT
jgi:hypothetical protein